MSSSSDYKDFGPYNEAAEEIRPSARIQLVQRVLNSAAIISSLASGVPLKWAQAYKAFQVLKPVNGQAPDDVTSPNAVSAVDSILHEAESQLRASNDDMTTLTTELDKLPFVGKFDRSHYMIDARSKKVAILSTQGKVIYFHISSFGIPDAYPNVMSDADWQALSADEKLPTSSWESAAICKHQVLFGSGADAKLLLNFTVFSKVGTSTGFLIDEDPYPVTVNAVIDASTQKVTVLVMGGSEEDKIIWPTVVDVSSTSITTKDVGQSSFAGDLLTTIDLPGEAQPSEYLGLPDPSDVIEILDGLVS